MRTFAWKHKKTAHGYRKAVFPPYRRWSGNQRTATVGSILRSTGIQAKLKAGGPGEPYELDADRASGIEAIKTGGRPLDPVSRTFFESRLGRDLGRVRLHMDSAASEIAESIQARAFTIGNHIVIGRGGCPPHTPTGQRLLGHELTHVIQQREDRISIGGVSRKQRVAESSDGAGRQQVIRRDLIDDIREGAEAIGTARLRALANKPTGSGGWTGADASCHANFCRPFADVNEALRDLVWAGPLILAGIATKVNPRVVPLWATYMTGGSAVEDLSGRFGADFSSSPTTQATTRFLIDALRRLVERDHATLMGGTSRVTLDVSSHLIDARRAINASGGPNEMNFNYPTDIAGNIAGGIGSDQSAHPFGARPSPVDDSRAATITATLVRDPSGTITVTPSIRYRVTDTIDLCPGNCGTSREQVATVPLSRFEATNLVGDVPFTIDFDAPAAELASFTVTPAPAVAPPPAAVHGVVTASALRYRAAPDTSSAVLGLYPRGTDLTLLCQTHGTSVLGVDTWYRTADGFVSGRYVSLTGAGTLAAC
ncbi:conserved hypothetical protein [Desulfosarcina cetonica]|nr:conserved hypothetical protein [Desulfosarcina cetonica]